MDGMEWPGDRRTAIVVFTAEPGKHHSLAATRRWPAVYFESDVQHAGVWHWRNTIRTLLVKEKAGL